MQGKTAIVLTIAFALAAWSTVTTPAAAKPDTRPPDHQIATSPEAAASALIEAHARARNSDASGIVGVLAPVVDTPAFLALTDEQQQLGRYLLGAGYYDTADYQSALRQLRLATAFPQARAAEWRLRYSAAARSEDWTDAITSFVTLSERWPLSLRDFSEEQVSYLIRRARELPQREAREREILVALRRSDWRSNEPFVDQSFRWQTLTALLLANGEIEQARVVARDVTGARPFLGMLIDRRYDPVVDSAERDRDIAALFEEDLAKLRRMCAEHEGRLEGVLEVVLALVRIGRADEALILVDAALARANSPPEGGQRFTNQESWINWAFDYRSLALQQLGRYEEALNALQRGAGRPEDGRRNVSQAINTAELLLRMGRPQEAISVFDDFDLSLTSPYGWMNAHYVQVCAHFELGQHAESARLVALMRERADDSWRVMRDTELCLGNIDRAASIYISALENPLYRNPALWDAQNFRSVGPGTELERRLGEALQRMLNQPDVRDAVDRNGRVLSLPVTRTGL